MDPLDTDKPYYVVDTSTGEVRTAAGPFESPTVANGAADRLERLAGHSAFYVTQSS